MANQIAETIAQQIGNGTFAMLGSRGTLMAFESGLQFDVRGSRKCNRVHVIYNAGGDDYTLRFFKGRGLNIKQVAEVEGCYVDNLHSVIESETGLATRL